MLYPVQCQVNCKLTESNILVYKKPKSYGAIIEY